MHNNTVSLFTDCPHREKLGWLEQTHLVAAGLMFNNDLRGLYAATARNMTDAQKADGMVPTIAPQYTMFGPKYAIFDDSPEWGSAAVLATWRAYQFYGDVAELERAYPTMQRYVAFLEGKAKDGIVDYGLGDWYDIGPGAPGFSKLTTPGVTATLMLYEDAVDMEKIATLLGKRRMRRSMGRWRSARRRRSMRGSSMRRMVVRQGESDGAGYAAGVGDCAGERVVAAVLEHMVADIHAHDDHVTAGEVGYPYMVRALMENGRSMCCWR